MIPVEGTGAGIGGSAGRPITGVSGGNFVINPVMQAMPP